jgi:hypothetical protein
VLIRLLAVLFNAFPVRWQRRFMSAAHDRFLEIHEETGLDVEVGPVLEVVTGHRWQRVEIVFAYRVRGGTAVLTGEIEELRSFAPETLPEVRADQRGLIERHAAVAIAWATRD